MLLNTAMKRRLYLIEFLAKQERWWPLEEAAAHLDCSTKTLITDVNYINDELEEYLHIDISKVRGIKAHPMQSNKINNIYQNVIQSSNEFQFLEQVFLNPDQDAEFWINKLFLSEATFYRMVSSVGKALKRRGLTLERKPFRITAPDERWVRFFYQAYFLEAYGTANWPFPIDRQELICFVMRTSTDFDILWDDHEIIEHAYLLMVTIIRASQGFLLSEAIYAEEDDLLDHLIKSNHSYSEKIASTQYVLVPEWYKETSRTVFYEYYTWDNQQQEIRIQTAVEHFLQAVSKAVDFPLSTRDEKKIVQQLMGLYSTYSLYPYDREILHNYSQESAQNIQRIYPIFSKIVSVNLREIEKDCNFPWVQKTESDVLCILLKEWENLPLQLESLRRRLSILIVSNMGIRHANMLRSLLKGQYGERFKIDLYKESPLFVSSAELKLFEEYDLVVTNDLLADYQHSNLMIVDNYLSETDWEVLNRRVITIQKEASDRYLEKLDATEFRSGRFVYPNYKHHERIATFIMDESLSQKKEQ
ncbi:helix-turn-helix domain-containing protein [Enterococcus canintestini]|uniref:Mga helix-turn-helix domain-containing protein n=1 Tax=Enterococcus canintestini TaxID=317010 RepID=A0A267HRS9_9ENTE|nr:helix-turn-helix domain-containing protein [Enterococcus canintestini]PAB01036.1 hypothetical protein AKL21_07200 [Enterococcus canintestini]